jgi:hypothetical protein
MTKVTSVAGTAPPRKEPAATQASILRFGIFDISAMMNSRLSSITAKSERA